MSCQVRGLLFDLDDTLFARSEHFDAFIREVHEAHGIGFSHSGPGLSSIRHLHEHLVQMAGDRAPSRTHLTASWTTTLRHRLRPSDQLLELLKDLSCRYKLAIVTNGSGRMQRMKCDMLGLSAVVERIIVSGEVGFRKPDPRIFSLALEAVGCEPRETMMIGNDPIADLGGAQAVGMRTCLIEGSAVGSNPEHICDVRLASVLELRKRLLP